VFDKKELIKKFLFDENLPKEEKRLRFEIAWDIWENFNAIKQEISLGNIFKPLKDRIIELINDSPYEITKFDWGSIYVAKPEWKEKEDDRGIYALCIEKWDRNWPTVGIVKNNSFKTDVEKEIEDLLKEFRKTQWFLIYIPIQDWEYGDPKTYFLEAILNPSSIVNFLFDYFEKLYKIVRKTEGLEELLDRSVKERKAQLQISA